MQTFLPYEDFKETAVVLDDRRLFNQRRECFQILLAILDKEYGWNTHPVVKQWVGHMGTLCDYAITICMETRARGGEDRMLTLFQGVRENLVVDEKKPWWLGVSDYHDSHKRMLFEKDPKAYAMFANIGGPAIYWWPSDYNLVMGRYIIKE